MTHTPADAAPAWHALSAEETCARLQTTPDGLSTTQAAQRLAAQGPNELAAPPRASPWRSFAAQFQNVLIVILIVATLISATLGHGIEAVAILVIVLFAVVLGFIQEYRAERAIDALRELAAPVVNVLRDGEETDVPARELVAGDVLLLSAGNRVGADARLLEAANLQIDEASLTGESVPAEKQSAPLDRVDLAVGDQSNRVFAGTMTTAGRGRAVVVATGVHTEFGKIAGLLATVETGRTPLQLNLDRLGTSLARVAIAVVTVIVVVGILRQQEPIEMLVFGIALAVAVVPEALPAVVTISLALGVRRLVKRCALMRRLPAVETLGSTSVICSDKTGTLTKDEMTARRLYVGGGFVDVSGVGYAPVGGFSAGGEPVKESVALRRLLEAAVLASDAHIVQTGATWHVKGDRTEGALVAVAGKFGLHKPELDRARPRTAEIPFCADIKWMTTLHRFDAATVAYTKGAPEVVLPACTRQLDEGGEVALDEAGRARVLAAANTMARSAMRVIAIASRSAATLDNAQHDMTLLGLVGLIDPPRPEAQAAIRTCHTAGIRVVMITGDHPATARAVAEELGVLQHGGVVVSGAEVDAMDDAQFDLAVERIDVYARVSPAHKLRVVTALQRCGHVVAMTGDGVNDAPALKKADIGVAMGITGTDVAKEASAMTLLDDNFASIVAAVEEGRAIFGNIRKYLMFLLSSNIGEIGLMAGATLLGLPLPLSAVQILYVNLATDGLPALALAVDPPEPGLMQRPPRDPRLGIFQRPVVVLMVIGGVWSTFVNLVVFTWALESGRAIVEAMTMTFVSLVLIQFFKAYNFRSDRQTVLRRPFANRWLNLAVLWEIALLLLIVNLPILHEPFDTAALTLHDWLVTVAASFSIVPVLELAKWMERRGWFGRLA
jgi:Ca2+-transporting ATPase